MKSLMGLEAGKRYLFMTVTFYWDGIVEELFPTHALITNARLVKDVGENPDFNKWARSDELHRRAWIPIPNVQILELDLVTGAVADVPPTTPVE